MKLELGHRAQVRKKTTVEGFTHDWMVFVRGAERGNIQHFVDKVVFHLHESFPKPKRGEAPGQRSKLKIKGNELPVLFCFFFLFFPLNCGKRGKVLVILGSLSCS